MSHRGKRGPIPAHRWSFLVRWSFVLSLVLTMGLTSLSGSAAPVLVPNEDDGGSGSATQAIDPKDVGIGISFVTLIGQGQVAVDEVSDDQFDLLPTCICGEQPY